MYFSTGTQTSSSEVAAHTSLRDTSASEIALSSDEAMTLDSSPSVSDAASGHYQFPSYRLRPQKYPNKKPLVLVACGSFSPITYLHLRMFELAADYVRFNTEFEVVGGYLSPVSDAYQKAGLARSDHRINMCHVAAQGTSEWLMVDPWEAQQPCYSPTAKVLDHFEHELNTVLGGIEVADPANTSSLTRCGSRKASSSKPSAGDANRNGSPSGEGGVAAPVPSESDTPWWGEGPRPRRPVRIALLAGADLIQTMSTPGIWSPADLDHILGRYGVFVIERAGTDVDAAISSLQTWAENIHVIQQVVQNDISSTKIRLFLKRDMSVRYLLPERVIEYIEAHGLYREGI